MTEREILTRVILDTRNSLETAQAAVCDLLDEIAIDLTALENLTKLLNDSNKCSSIEAGKPCAATVSGILEDVTYRQEGSGKTSG